MARASLPEKIGPYEVLRRLGDGGMGQTFEALLRRPGGFEKRVCIKCMRFEISKVPSFREEFLQEACIHAQLDHANIVDIYDSGEHEGQLYLVLKLIEGVTLSQLLSYYAAQRRLMPPTLAAYVVAEVAEALHYAHTFHDRSGVLRKVVHRDVSVTDRPM